MTREKMSAGAQRAFEAMTYEWQQPSASTFNWAGAAQAAAQRPDLVEWAVIKLGKQKYGRDAYRLK